MPRSCFIINRESEFSNRGKAKVVNGPNFDGDWQGRYFPGYDWRTVQAVTRFEQVDCGGASLWFDAELAGPGGVSVVIYAEPDTTPEQITAAKHRLRNQLDVVRMSVFHITEILL